MFSADLLSHTIRTETDDNDIWEEEYKHLIYLGLETGDIYS